MTAATAHLAGRGVAGWAGSNPVEVVGVSTRMRDGLARSLGLLRHEPTEKRIRATLGGHTVLDSVRAVLVWEPRRVVPSYAVPVADLRAALAARADGFAPADDPAVGVPLPALSDRPVLDPSIPFAVHSTPGEPVAVRTPAGAIVAGFRPADPDLADHVILDFAGVDAWYEEDERIVSHPRDPFHRIDILPSSREVRVELGGEVLAESTTAWLLFETMLPVRYYLPPEDVRVPLRESPTRTFCAYKGEASYWSPELAGTPVEDLVWGYRDPLREAAPVRGLVAFFTERADLVLDGVRQARPVTPWSNRGATG